MQKSTSDIFCLNKSEIDGHQIFSIGGSPSFRINRRRQVGSNVFPFGCMGCAKEIPDLPTSVNNVPEDDEDDVETVNENFVKLPEAVEDTPQINSKRPMPPYQGLSARNPLTGEGIEIPNPNKGRKGSMRKSTHSKWAW